MEPPRQNGIALCLDRIRFWIFDLDNTLYPPDSGILDAMHARTVQFIRRYLDLDTEAAVALRRCYQQTYGTALRGLTLHHGVSQVSFIDYVHRVDLSAIKAAPSLAAVMRRLPGLRLVHTNAPRRHAEAVMERLGITGAIDGLLDISAADYIPKPDGRSYARLIRAFDVWPAEACMFEDQDRNLRWPVRLGMKTVLVAPAGDDQVLQYAHDRTGSLEAYLSGCQMLQKDPSGS